MLLDRTHKRWFWFTVIFLVASGVLFWIYATRTPGGPTGGSAWGLAFGIVGTLFMFFAAFLGVRKKRPHYRIGRAAWWLKGHLWLGALSFPIILFHTGFSFGGPIGRTLMWLFIVVYVTGLVGLLLQQVLPRYMTKALPQETVFEQIEHVRDGLLEEVVELVRGTPARRGAVARAKSGGRVQGRVVESRAAVEERGEGPDREPLEGFVDRYVRDFFERRKPKKAALWDHHTRAALFEELERRVDPRLQPVVDDLRAYCEQREQLEQQRRLHLWLHGWLLVHVPVSWTLVMLTAVHAVMSLFY